ncbi:MAG: hypothetical protein K2Q22_03490, partial [Cytophagales bacterium]|nr:hypothetical protein [Cytophagales bacterium]
MLEFRLFINYFKEKFLSNVVSVMLLVCFFIYTPVDGSTLLTLRSSSDEQPLALGSHFQFLEDTSGKLTIQEVVKLSKQTNWKQSNSYAPNFTTRNPVWAVAEWEMVEATYPLLQIINGGLDSLEVYFFDSSGKLVKCYKRTTLGLVNQQEYKLPAFVFDVPNIPRVKVFLRMYSTVTMTFKVQVGDQKSIYDANIVRVGLHCLYFGIIMIMVLYNFFIFISTRDWAYLFYIIFGFLFAAHVAHLQGFDIYLPESITNVQQKYFRAIAMMCTGFGGVFAIIFLQVKTYLPKAYGLYIVCISASFINLFYSLTGHNLLLSYLIMRLCSSVPLVIYLITSWMIYKRGYQPAIFFFVAFLGFEACLIINICVQAGVIPNVSMLTEYVMHMGSAFELLTLSLALAYRINLLKKEKVRIQKENLRLVSEQKE